MRKLFTFIGLSLFLMGCGDQEKDEFHPENFRLEILEENTLLVNELLANALEKAVRQGTYMDAEEILAEVRELPEIEEAVLNDPGNSIIARQTDGSYVNFLLYDSSDDDYFIKDPSAKSLSKRAVHFPEVYPAGSGRAIILAPFYHEKVRTESIDIVYNMLEKAGFKVDPYYDENATLDKFRGDFLANYDVIIIDTHGNSNMTTLDKRKSTGLFTGQKVTTKEQYESLDRTVGVGTVKKQHYVVATVPFMESTTTREFPNSWVIMNACGSSKIVGGEASLVSYFGNHGAKGINGYEEIVATRLIEEVLKEMTVLLTSGYEFMEASEKVINNPGFDLPWYFRLAAGIKATTYYFSGHQPKGIKFYLIPQDAIVGKAEVIPNQGVVGTKVVYQVTISEKYVDQVASIEFDIDNTNEHLSMTKSGRGVWIRDELSAPNSSSYPRIDTFTFTAYDGNHKEIGFGSATFTILTGSQVKSTGKPTYYERE